MPLVCHIVSKACTRVCMCDSLWVPVKSLNCLLTLQMVWFVLESHALFGLTVSAMDVFPPQSPREFEIIYNKVRTDGMFMLHHNDLDLGKNLGKGNFGSVMSGMYRSHGREINVAVKVLKANDATAEVSSVFHLMLLRTRDVWIADGFFCGPGSTEYFGSIDKLQIFSFFLSSRCRASDVGHHVMPEFPVL